MNKPEVMKVFMEIHTDNPQEGPGDCASTQHAFSFLNELPATPHILDIGCGPGRQTLDLSRLTNGTIVAVDNHLPFLDKLRHEASETGNAVKIKTLQCDMGNLQFDEELFDVVWSEGAIYNIGFETGLRKWKPLLKTGGYLVVSELTWLQSGAPDNLRKFWREEYPAMKDTARNLMLIQHAGYHLIAHFTIAESAWWAYYRPIEKRLLLLRKKYQAMPNALAVVEREQQGIDMYRTYADYFGYVFYICQRKEIAKER